MEKRRSLRVVIVSLIFVFMASNVVASQIKDGSEHDLSKAMVMDRVILAVLEHYYDPFRIDPEKMFKEAVIGLELVIPELRVETSESNQSMSLAISQKQIKVDLKKVSSLWGLSHTMRRVFAFIYKTLPKEGRDYRLMEYAAVNNALSILDPHTSAMMPEIWDELRMSTHGAFEGVGIRITVDRRPPCNGELTVVDVFENTPAEKSGMKRGDKIIKIEGDSTINITTSEAADRLRGKPGTRVKVTVRRPDGTQKNLVIARKRIPIKSVKHKMLKGNVGYVSILAVQNNTVDELSDALEKLHEENMKGLVLDLRGNPGGLLDAAIKIADMFLSGGTIVTTAGRREEDRDVSNASSLGDEIDYPLVVMIDSNSASAAEIIAGALRNHNRALLIGKTTFGKGSVQRIIALPGGGAMRLTIAQYLTPGDISIQAIGVAPDVSFNPIVVDKEELMLNGGQKRFSEADLEAHLNRPNQRDRSDRPGAMTSTVFVPNKERKADLKMFQQCYISTEDRDSFQSRYETDFARRLIIASNKGNSVHLSMAAKRIIQEDEVKGQAKLAKALKTVNVDWSLEDGDKPQAQANGKDNEKKGNPDVVAKVKMLGKVVPGEPLKIQVSVKNKTNKTIHQLRASMQSDNHLFSGHELVFGLIKPNKTKKWTTIINIPAIVEPRVDPVTIKFYSNDIVPKPVSVDIAVPIGHEPRLEYSWHLEDLGNGNGFVESGEEFLMYVWVKNIGNDSTFKIDGNLSAKPGVDIKQGRFKVEKIAKGEAVEGVFRLKLADNFHLDRAELRLNVEEWVPTRLIPVTRSLISRKIELPVSKTQGKWSPEKAIVSVKEGSRVDIYTAPDVASRVIAYGQPGASFKAVGVFNDFLKIQLQENQHAWILRANTQKGNVPKPSFDWITERPPVISIEGQTVAVTAKKDIKINGLAEHENGVRDVIVYVNNRKVSYLLNSAKDNNLFARKLKFDIEVPLKDGPNRIMITARHSDETVSMQSVFVRRKSEDQKVIQ